jgi:hypothetical protein
LADAQDKKLVFVDVKSSMLKAELLPWFGKGVKSCDVKFIRIVLLLKEIY